MPDENGECELDCMDESYADDSFTPFLQCDDCGMQYDLQLNKMKKD